MGRESQSWLEAALKMPVDERAFLAEQLLSSLEGEDSTETDEIWLIEMQKRLGEVDSGQVELISYEDVKKSIQEKFGNY